MLEGQREKDELRDIVIVISAFDKCFYSDSFQQLCRK